MITMPASHILHCWCFDHNDDDGDDVCSLFQSIWLWPWRPVVCRWTSSHVGCNVNSSWAQPVGFGNSTLPGLLTHTLHIDDCHHHDMQVRGWSGWCVGPQFMFSFCPWLFLSLWQRQCWRLILMKINYFHQNDDTDSGWNLAVFINRMKIMTTTSIKVKLKFTHFNFSSLD